MANEIKMMAGSAGSDLYDGAGTYKTSDGTLRKGVRSIFIRVDQAAMVTSMKVADVVWVGNIIGGNLLGGIDFFTFPDEITEIITVGGSFIGYEA